MTERLILSGFVAFAGFGLPCDLREAITIPASAKNMRRVRRAPAPRWIPAGGPEARQAAVDDGGDRCDDRSSRRNSSRPSRAADDQINNGGSWGIGSARQRMHRLWERGRRRTRQDQISRWAWRPGEIAELERSAPNEENQFLLPDRFSMKRLSPSKGRSSRLT